MSDQTDPLLSRLRARVREAGGTRSQAGVWMAENAEALAEMIRVYGPDWQGWAEDFVEAGRVKRPEDWDKDREKARARIGESLRRTWLRVREREEGSGASPRPRRPSPAQAPAPAPAIPPAATTDGAAQLRRMEQRLASRS